MSQSRGEKQNKQSEKEEIFSSFFIFGNVCFDFSKGVPLHANGKTVNQKSLFFVIQFIWSFIYKHWIHKTCHRKSWPHISHICYLRLSLCHTIAYILLFLPIWFKLFNLSNKISRFVSNFFCSFRSYLFNRKFCILFSVFSLSFLFQSLFRLFQGDVKTICISCLIV